MSFLDISWPHMAELLAPEKTVHAWKEGIIEATQVGE